MLSPDIWFTLYALAKRGALHGRCNITTKELGHLLDVSQQTASRRILEAVEHGYLTKTHAPNGMSLEITEKGKKELIDVANGLEVAFAPPSDEIVIEGVVMSGLGEGAYYVDIYSERIEKALGFEPYSGTLNVQIVGDAVLRQMSKMRHSPPIVVPGFTKEGRTFGDVICYRVIVNDRFEAAVVIAQRTHHSEDILEVISPVNLREVLKIKDGDSVKLKVVPLHLAS